MARLGPVSRPLGLRVVVLPALLMTACESTPPPVVPTQSGPTVAAVPTGPEPPPAEPADVVATFRWKSPSATFVNMAGCAGMPSPLADAGARGALEAALEEAFAGQADPKQLAAAVALDAPIDGLVALAPDRGDEPIGAISIGLSSLEGARAAVEAVQPLKEDDAGLFRIGVGDATSSPGVLCAIGASAGSTPARLVCAPNAKALSALAPYVLRSLPLAPSAAADMRSEVRWAPIDQRYGTQLRTAARGLGVAVQLRPSFGDPLLDKAVAEAAGAVGEEVASVANDLDGVSIEATTDAATCLRSTVSLSLKSSTSWTAGVLVDRPDRAGPPPPIFWRAPKDSESAFYARGGDPAKYTEILRVLRDLVEGGLNTGAIGSPPDRKAVADLLSFPMQKDVATVEASGHFDPPRAAGASQGPQQILVDKLSRAYMGWSLVGMETPADPVIKWLRDFVSVYNRKTLLDPLKKQLGKDSNMLPVIRVVQPPAALGARALDIEIKLDIDEATAFATPNPTLNRAPKADHSSITAHILVMADGSSTWIAMGPNRDDLLKKLKVVRTGAPATDTLAARTDLAALKDGTLMSGGFLTLAELTRPAISAVEAFSSIAGATPIVNDLTNALTNLPHRGETPVFLTTAVAGGAKPHVDVNFAVTKGTMEDIKAIALAGLQIANSLPFPRAKHLPKVKPSKP